MMIPITRKEKYINEIVGGGNTAPETPQTREELFFAGILGEVVAPSPITRAEKYLAKIANKYSGELPEPVTRIERFLARAAGMDVAIPTPITREEMFWADYALIVEKELSGIPPLTFNAIAGTLKNYRIYGNTVGGESVGDRTGNLFDENSLISPVSGFTWYFDDEHYLLATDATRDNRAWRYNQSQFQIALSAGTYTLRLSGVGATSRYSDIYVFKSNNDVIYSENITDKTNIIITFTLNTPESIGIEVKLYGGKYRIMLVEGSTALPYEPYGYRIPITNNAETANIYLDEPLAKSGNNADYIDYATQKRHNSDGTESSVTLPEISTLAGTNTLSVVTTVQPSEVYIKYEGAR